MSFPSLDFLVDINDLFRRFDDTRAPVKELRDRALDLNRWITREYEVLDHVRGGSVDTSYPYTYTEQVGLAEADFAERKAEYNERIADIQDQLEFYA